MATYCGSKDITITFGGVNVTSMFEPKADLEREAILQNSTPFGSIWPTWLDTGSRKLAPLSLTGIEQFQATTGSRAIFAEGTSGVFVVTYGGAKTSTVMMLVNKYKSTLAPEKLHVFTVTLQPTGAVVEA